MLTLRGEDSELTYITLVKVQGCVYLKTLMWVVCALKGSNKVIGHVQICAFP